MFHKKSVKTPFVTNRPQAGFSEKWIAKSCFSRQFIMHPARPKEGHPQKWSTARPGGVLVCYVHFNLHIKGLEKRKYFLIKKEEEEKNIWEELTVNCGYTMICTCKHIGAKGKKVHIRAFICAVVCAPKLICAPKLLCALMHSCALICELNCALVYAPKLICAPKLVCVRTHFLKPSYIN